MSDDRYAGMMPRDEWAKTAVHQHSTYSCGKCGQVSRPASIDCETCGKAIAVSPYGRVPSFCGAKCRKASYGGSCVQCGARTDGSNGAGAAPARCSACAQQPASLEARVLLGASMKGTGRTWTDEELMAALLWIAVDGRVTAKMCRDRYEAGIGTRRPFPSPQAYLIRWGSWNAAVEACGLTHGKACREYTRMSLERLASDVATAAVALGKLPTVAEYDRFKREHPELASCVLIRRRFGGWPEALVASVQWIGDGLEAHVVGAAEVIS